MQNACHFSPCRAYRYTLLHDFRDLTDRELRLVAWIGLNPSTADENKLDPTLTRIREFTRAFGGNAFVMLNLFAYRATDPRGMLSQAAPIGTDNDFHLIRETGRSMFTVCAWGNIGTHNDRYFEVLRTLRAHNRDLRALRITGKGQPSHPLYLPANLTPQPF